MRVLAAVLLVAGIGLVMTAPLEARVSSQAGALAVMVGLIMVSCFGPGRLQP